MTQEREVSAIDAIYLILEKLEILDKKIHVVDDNIKVLSNKVTKLSRASSEVSTGSAVDAAIAKDYRSQNISSQQKVQKLVLGNIRAFGYIVNRERLPISDVSVKIYDAKNEIIKDNKTDTNGYWEVRLPVGKYGVEYIHKNFKAINRTIVLDDSITEFEVR